MSTWTNNKTATLKVTKAGTTSETFTFNGINASASAGTPENYLDAVNHLLNIAGTSATITGMTRTVTQGVAE